MPVEKKLLFLISAGELLPFSSFKFSFTLDGQKQEGFVINENGGYYAYVNKCRHMGITLDWDTNDFYTPDQKRLICKTHGATYHPETGECAGGPCLGKSLFPLPLVQDSGRLLLDLAKTAQLYSK
jgi:nitrite reductase/ring-hydroxylating ferredoxin subunit